MLDVIWLYVYLVFIIIVVVSFFFLLSFAWQNLLRHSRAFELSSDCGHRCIFMGAGGLIWHFYNFQEMIHLSRTFRQFYKVLPWVSRLQYSTFGSMEWLNKSLAALFRVLNQSLTLANVCLVDGEKFSKVCCQCIASRFVIIAT